MGKRQKKPAVFRSPEEYRAYFFPTEVPSVDWAIADSEEATEMIVSKALRRVQPILANFTVGAPAR